MSRVAPSDDGDSGAIWSDIKLLHNASDEPRDVMPAIWIHWPSRVQYESQVYHSATAWRYSNISTCKWRKCRQSNQFWVV